MPPGVHSATHIWDMHGMSKRLNLNPAPVAEMLQAAQLYFAERVHELVIVDMPRWMGLLKDAVWPMVPERTRQKVRFMTAEQAKTHVASSCPSKIAARISAAMDQNRDP